ncbi:MAG: pilus assembly protein PilZ [Novosphingobium sp. SCN 63-17]|nr:PilZ domain-containing protein [Novosphingobium sp.]ODU83862.1 MAG: pilus assembly protein PilZ [Novosphingobium sp. SCN 63-17]OJX93120.1 MAG: pilus assembly protein PilZ [Novosphingobium sp. 63-713]
MTAVCEVRQGMAEWRRVTLDELSPGGFRINRFGEADPSQPLRIRIPGLQMLSARIVWQKDGAIGCAFAAPLHEAVFAHVTRSLTR